MTAFSPLYTTAQRIYAKSGVCSSDVDLGNEDIARMIIGSAEAELEMITARKFTDANTVTERLNTNQKDILGNYATSFTLTHYPIQSISSFSLVDIDGNAVSTFAALTTIQIAAGTWETTDYWLDTQNDPLTNLIVPNGHITLKTKTIPPGVNNVKITYSYGYLTAAPLSVIELATCLASIRVWIRFLGGSDNRLNSYSIPQQNADKGDFYARGKQNIEMLQKEADDLLDRIGRKPRILAFSTGGQR